MMELLRSNDPVLLSFAVSLLEDAGIRHAVADSHMSVIEGSIGAFPTRILVAEEQHGEACDLFADAGISTDPPRR